MGMLVECLHERCRVMYWIWVASNSSHQIMGGHSPDSVYPVREESRHVGEKDHISTLANKFEEIATHPQYRYKSAGTSFRFSIYIYPVHFAQENMQTTTK